MRASSTRWWALLTVGLGAATAACGTVLAISPSDGGDTDAGADVEPGSASDAGTDGGGDAPGDREAGVGTCVKTTPCPGTELAADPFTSLPPGVWTAQGTGVSLDQAAYASPPSSLRAIGDPSAGGGGIDRPLTTTGPRLCVELCTLVDYDPAAFGDAATDFVKLLIVTLRTGDAGDRVGELNLGLAQREYAFSDGTSPGFTVAQFPAGAFPRGRWAHVRLMLDYGTSPSTFGILVDDAPALGGPVVPVSAFSSISVSLGALVSGTYGRVDARFDDLRVTSY